TVEIVPVDRARSLESSRAARSDDAHVGYVGHRPTTEECALIDMTPKIAPTVSPARPTPPATRPSVRCDEERSPRRGALECGDASVAAEVGSVRRTLVCSPFATLTVRVSGGFGGARSSTACVPGSTGTGASQRSRGRLSPSTRTSADDRTEVGTWTTSVG